MPLRDTLRKVTGLLIELPEEDRKTQEETGDELRNKPLREQREKSIGSGLMAAGASEPRDSEQVDPATAQPSQVSIDAEVDFSTIYRQANVPAAPFTAEQMLEMLSTLPPELSLSAGRQMLSNLLKTMVKTIHATPESIGADASHKIEALDSYAKSLSKQTASMITGAEREIAAMQAQIEERQRAIEVAQGKLTQVLQVCQAESNRLNAVLEFFNADVAE